MDEWIKKFDYSAFAFSQKVLQGSGDIMNKGGVGVRLISKIGSEVIKGDVQLLVETGWVLALHLGIPYTDTDSDTLIHDARKQS